MPLWKRGSPSSFRKRHLRNQDAVEGLHQKCAGAIGRDRGQMPGLNFTRIGDDSAHLANNRVEKAARVRAPGFFGGGDFVKDRRLQNLRRVIVIFGGVNHRARSARGGFFAKSLRQDAMNAAGRRPGIETDAGHGGGDFFRLGHSIHQTRDILRRGGILHLHWAYTRRFHAVVRGRHSPHSTRRCGEEHRRRPAPLHPPPAERNSRSEKLRKEKGPPEWPRNRNPQTCDGPLMPRFSPSHKGNSQWLVVSG